MKHRYFILFLLIQPFYSSATEFKICNFERYGETPNLELCLLPDHGKTPSEIFETIQTTRSNMSIRLIGESSSKTNSELITFYRDNMPKELDIALKSSGNIHNPALLPLKKAFNKALKSTSLYKSLAFELKKHGFKIIGISFEKFHIRKDGNISIPDVWLECDKNA